MRDYSIFLERKTYLARREHGPPRLYRQAHWPLPNDRNSFNLSKPGVVAFYEGLLLVLSYIFHQFPLHIFQYRQFRRENQMIRLLPVTGTRQSSVTLKYIYTRLKKTKNYNL